MTNDNGAKNIGNLCITKNLHMISCINVYIYHIYVYSINA